MKRLKTGVLIILPFLVFIWLITKIKNFLFGVSDNILFVFPQRILPENITFLKIIIIIFIVLLVYLLGYLYNHSYIGKNMKIFGRALVSKIPVLSTFYRVARQIEETLSQKNSFKEVVLVEFPVQGMYSIGFITSDKTEAFESVLGGKYVSVFIPTTPNPTNGWLVLVEIRKVKVLKIPVQRAVEYIISMGTSIIT